MMGKQECETAHAGWRRRWKYWGSRRDDDDHTYAAFMNMPFVRSFEVVSYETKLSELIGRLH